MVEVLVAISVLLLATVGPMTIASRSLQHAEFVAQQNTAFFLAQEGIEAIVAVRNEYALEYFDNPSGVDPWDWYDDAALSPCRSSNGCDIEWEDFEMLDEVASCPATGCPLYYNESATRARYRHQSAGSDATPFTRSVTIESLNPTTVSVTSRVRWQAPNQEDERSVVLQTYLHDIYDPS